VETILSERSEGAEKALAKRILIADDTMSSRVLLRSILEASGHEVAEAEDGMEVLERASAFQPALVILDLQMPRLDGYAAATALRKMAEFERTPVIALTAVVSQVAPEKMAAAGFSAYLIKPISPARLRQCIADFL
jgi:CheY-like chemotaxis protein